MMELLEAPEGGAGASEKDMLDGYTKSDYTSMEGDLNRNSSYKEAFNLVAKSILSDSDQVTAMEIGPGGRAVLTKMMVEAVPASKLLRLVLVEANQEGARGARAQLIQPIKDKICTLIEGHSTEQAVIVQVHNSYTRSNSQAHTHTLT